MDEADVIINNNEHFNGGLKVFEGFLKQYLVDNQAIFWKSQESKPVAGPDRGATAP